MSPLLILRSMCLLFCVFVFHNELRDITTVDPVSFYNIYNNVKTIYIISACNSVLLFIPFVNTGVL